MECYRWYYYFRSRNILHRSDLEHERSSNRECQLRQQQRLRCSYTDRLQCYRTRLAHPYYYRTGTGLCRISGNVYSTQSGNSDYIWSVSSGGTITAGGGTGSNTVTVTWNTAGAQTVSVNYYNSAGCSADAPVVYNVTVDALPVPTITGQTSLCVNSGNYTYSTEANMQNYVWSVSSGGVINNGSGSDQIQVSWVVAGAQTVSVTYSNSIGCSAAQPTVLDVTVNPLPGPAGSITGTSEVCAGENGVAYSVGTIANADTYV